MKEHQIKPSVAAPRYNLVHAAAGEAQPILSGCMIRKHDFVSSRRRRRSRPATWCNSGGWSSALRSGVRSFADPEAVLAYLRPLHALTMIGRASESSPAPKRDQPAVRRWRSCRPDRRTLNLVFARRSSARRRAKTGGSSSPVGAPNKAIGRQERLHRPRPVDAQGHAPSSIQNAVSTSPAIHPAQMTDGPAPGAMLGADRLWRGALVTRTIARLSCHFSGADHERPYDP